MSYDFEQEDYTRACEALFRRCQRRMWVYMQPNRYQSELTNEGIIILQANDEELARYDTSKRRILPLA